MFELVLFVTSGSSKAFSHRLRIYRCRSEPGQQWWWGPEPSASPPWRRPGSWLPCERWSSSPRWAALSRKHSLWITGEAGGHARGHRQSSGETKGLFYNYGQKNVCEVTVTFDHQNLISLSLSPSWRLCPISNSKHFWGITFIWQTDNTETQSLQFVTLTSCHKIVAEMTLMTSPQNDMISVLLLDLKKLLHHLKRCHTTLVCN